MEYTTNSAVEKLLSSFQAYYNVKEYTDAEKQELKMEVPLRAF